MSKANIEAVVNGSLLGWFWNDKMPSEQTIHIVGDGIYLGFAMASEYRDDLAQAFDGSGNHGFSFVLPRRFRAGNTHVFALALSKSDISETLTSKTLLSPLVEFAIDGRVERLDNRRVFGWAWNSLEPEQRLEINAYCDGTLLGSCVADQRRDDLRAKGMGDGRYGFSLPLSSWLFSVDTALDIMVTTSAESRSTVIGNISLPPAVPQNHDAIERIHQTPGIDEAFRRLRSFSGSDIFAHAKHKSDMERLAIQINNNHIGVTLQNPIGWVRLMRLTPSVRRLMESDWRVTVKLSSEVAGTLYLNLVTFSSSGTFVLVCRITKLSFDIGNLDANVVLRSKVLRSSNPDLADRPTFLCVETTDPVSFNLFMFDIEQRPIEVDNVPFRNSEHPVAVQIASLNDRMANSARKDAVGWSLDMVDVAIRAECFETASALLHKVSVNQHSKDHDLIRYLNLFSEIAFAEGRIDQLRVRLLESQEVVLKDDRLFTAFSMCFPAAPELSEYFGTLPSGRPNRCYLSRGRLTSAALRSCLKGGVDFDDCQTMLLLASLMKDVSPEAWVHNFNSYLGQFQLAPIKGADLKAENVLGSIRFKEASPATESTELVTIVMSAFNAGKTIEYAINSLLSQTYRNIEILICDDVSTDDTLSKMLGHRNNPRIKLFQSNANQGPYNIRNALMSKASGKYITFHDADDVAHPERIEKQTLALSETGKAASVGRWVRIRPNGEVAFFRDHRCLRLSVVSLLADRELFRQIGGYRSALCGADSELFERIRLSSGRSAIEEVDMPLIFGLWSAQSLTQQSGLEATEDGFRSKARRSYAEAAARHRFLGESLSSSASVDDINKSHGIYREFHGVRFLGGANERF